MPGGVLLAEPDWPMCAKLLSADGPAEASSVVCASLRRGLETGRRAGRCGGCDSAAQAARQAQSTTSALRMVSSPIQLIGRSTCRNQRAASPLQKHARQHLLSNTLALRAARNNDDLALMLRASEHAN